jgi:alpha-glucosidase
MEFGCEVTANSLRLTLGKHEGAYAAWWREVHIEVYGWSSHEHTARLNGRVIDAVPSSSPGRVELTIPDDAKGSVLEMK